MRMQVNPHHDDLAARAALLPPRRVGASAIISATILAWWLVMIVRHKVNALLRRIAAALGPRALDARSRALARRAMSR